MKTCLIILHLYLFSLSIPLVHSEWRGPFLRHICISWKKTDTRTDASQPGNGVVDNGSILYWRQTSQVKNAIRVWGRRPTLWCVCSTNVRRSTEPMWKSGCNDAFCRICSPAAGEVDTGGSLGLAVQTAYLHWGGQWETLSQKSNTRRGCLVVIFGLCIQHRTDLRTQGGK